jgi:hypothetical protein
LFTNYTEIGYCLETYLIAIRAYPSQQGRIITKKNGVEVYVRCRQIVMLTKQGTSTHR